MFFQITMSKRTAEDGGNGSSQPPIKKVHFEPHLIGPVSTLEEMDIKVLQFQNKKLAQVYKLQKKNKCFTFIIAGIAYYCDRKCVPNIFIIKQSAV